MSIRSAGRQIPHEGLFAEASAMVRRIARHADELGDLVQHLALRSLAEYRQHDGSSTGSGPPG